MSNKNENKSGPVEVVVPGGMTDTAPAPVAGDRTTYAYVVPGGRIVARKATGKTAKDRPLIFTPSGEAERYAVTADDGRKLLTLLAESDAAARAAILAGNSPVMTSSKVTPDAALWADAKSLIAERADALAGDLAAALAALPEDADEATIAATSFPFTPGGILRDMLAAGLLIVPAKVRKDRAAKSDASLADADLAALFA